MTRERILRSISPVILFLAVAIAGGCGPSEPLPDHLGLFASQGSGILELTKIPSQDTPDLTDFDGFWTFFAQAQVLDDLPDHFIVYDTTFSEGDLHLYMLSPSWHMSSFHTKEAEIPLLTQPVENKPGMFRLRTAQPLAAGIYLIAGRGATPRGTGNYMAGLCAKCSLDARRTALAKVRDDEAARLNAATIPSQVLAQSSIAFWYGPWPQSLTWNVTVTDTNISWNGYRTATISYSEIQSVQLMEAQGGWGGILCLTLPPKIGSCNDTVQVSTIKVLEEIPKLREIARVAQEAVAAWHSNYPNGLPYALPDDSQ